MKRNASAVRSGGLRDGNGMHTNRNPGEAIAASHAGCLSMALSAQRGEGGLKAERIATTAMVTLEKSGEGFSISAVRLDLEARIPGSDRQAFEIAAHTTKSGGPVSKALDARNPLNADLQT